MPQANKNPTCPGHSSPGEYRERVRNLLPAGAVALYSPACTCAQGGAPCKTCKSYSDAGHALESAAAALGGLEF